MLVMKYVASSILVQFQIYNIPCSLSLRVLGSIRGSLGRYIWLDTKIVLKKVNMVCL